MWVGTSWKMSKTLAEARAWVRAVTAEPVPPGVTAFVLPSHTALAAVRDEVPAGHGLWVGAQDAHWDSAPEWTGEVSAPQVRDAGAVLVELGHSERRTRLGEDDLVVARKVRAVVDAGMTPLVCVGEQAVDRSGGRQVDVVVDQLRAALASLSPNEAAGALVAYEPVWSIGRTGRPATPEDIAPVVAALRDAATEWTARGPRALLYGGSVTADNAPDLLAVEGVDGVFVGRDAWEAAGFLRLLSVATGAAELSGSGAS